MEEKKKSNFLQKIATSYRKIPDKKPYIEFVTAILSVPVLLTVILLNFNSLTGSKDEKKDTTVPPQTIVITAPASNNETTTTQQEECTPEVGPIEITSPEEGEEVSNNPLFVSIRYGQDDFCSVVWSYRINNGAWSEYDDRSIALYNPPPGTIKLELRVKSVVGTDTAMLTRNFTYRGTELIPQTATESAN
ncbi:MAG TPA: hypothetical protein VLF20_01505 [Patescibacteria group bacterium]|nr:hypothetical protein [Patescibacteria group bacterium]